MSIKLLRVKTVSYTHLVLVNPVAKFLGGISFEIYLCHMVIYRVLEKFHLVDVYKRQFQGWQHVRPRAHSEGKNHDTA